MAWILDPSDEFARRQKYYEKKHSRELQAVLANLDFYVASLNNGVLPHQIKSGFIHTEGQGVVAIDQKGQGKNLAQARLYVYAELETETLHIVTLGDKRSQRDDLRTCRNYVESLRKAREQAPPRLNLEQESSATHEEEVQQRAGDGQGDVG